MAKSNHWKRSLPKRLGHQLGFDESQIELQLRIAEKQRKKSLGLPIDEAALDESEIIQEILLASSPITDPTKGSRHRAYDIRFHTAWCLLVVGLLGWTYIAIGAGEPMLILLLGGLAGARAVIHFLVFFFVFWLFDAPVGTVWRALVKLSALMVFMPLLFYFIIQMNVFLLYPILFIPLLCAFVFAYLFEVHVLNAIWYMLLVSMIEFGIWSIAAGGANLSRIG